MLEAGRGLNTLSSRLRSFQPGDDSSPPAPGDALLKVTRPLLATWSWQGKPLCLLAPLPSEAVSFCKSLLI